MLLRSVWFRKIHTVTMFTRGHSPSFQMLLRSAPRKLSGICTSGVPWHSLVATSSIHSWCSRNRSCCFPHSSVICVRWGNQAGGTSCQQKTFLEREQFLVITRSKASWSRKFVTPHSPATLLSLHSQPLLSSPQLSLKSPNFSLKTSSEDSSKPGIIAR